MNTLNAALVCATVVLAGIGPIIGVIRGGKTFALRPPQLYETYYYKITMKGRHMPRMLIAWDDDDLLTADQLADHFGYSRDHVRHMLRIDNKAADARLIRLKIATDDTWRQTNRSRAQFVFQYSELRKWYKAKQRRQSLMQTARRTRGTPSPLI